MENLGSFTRGNISSTNDARLLIKKIVKKNFILIGSSMGSWIGLNQFKYFKDQIRGFIGIVRHLNSDKADVMFTKKLIRITS